MSLYDSYYNDMVADALAVVSIHTVEWHVHVHVSLNNLYAMNIVMMFRQHRAMFNAVAHKYERRVYSYS